MGVLIALLGVAGGGIFFLFSKWKSAEALNSNNDTKGQLLEKDKVIAVNNGSLSTEEARRNDAAKAAEEKKNENSAKDVLDFLNNLNNPPK